MSLNIEMRCLAHAEPHQPVILGPDPLVSDRGVTGLRGEYNLLGARRGMTISAFDFTPADASHAPMRSDPCVALNILFEGAGHSWFEDGAETSADIPFRPAFYCMIAPQGARGCDVIRPGTRFRGVDIRMTPALWNSLGGPARQDLGSDADAYRVASTGSVWAGMLPLSPEVREMARSLSIAIRSKGSDITSEARALDIINAAIGLLTASGGRRNAHLLQRDLRAIRAVIDMMQADLARPWQLGELALAAGIGLKRLKQQFPKHTGMPVYVWLQEARLQKAAQLLAAGDVSVTWVSLAVGYSSLSHFSALFRRRFGLSPSALRGQASIIGKPG